jgi:c(7)-type cytochrome triheme protein
VSRVLRAGTFALLPLLLAAQASSGSGKLPVTVRLPADIVYGKAADAPDKVVFSHAVHAGLAENKCLPCHPQPFRMLRPARRATHEAMDAGKSCGTCHDGKAAFATADENACERCHSGERKP